VAPGKTRCHAQGGAPRSGAPKGNRNAVKHGRYVGGRVAVYAKRKAERQQCCAGPIRRLERALAQRARGRPPRCKETGGPVYPVWEAVRERKSLVRQMKVLERGLNRKGPITGSAFSGTYACYLALKILCAERPSFASRQALIDEICSVASLGYDEEWLGNRRGITCMTSFIFNWRRFCATLYEVYFPVPPRKPRKKSTKAEQLEGKHQDEQPEDKHQELASMGFVGALFERLKTDPDLTRLPFRECANQICLSVCDELKRYIRSPGVSADDKNFARLMIRTIKAETAEAVGESM
jgi:hypothetical protein